MKIYVCFALFAVALQFRGQAQSSSAPTSLRQRDASGIFAPTPAPLSANDTARTAHYLVTVTDDFTVEIYLNGQPVPVTQRTLLVETFGATTEKVKIDVKPGDWVVFNVVNDRLRWGGSCYFGVAGMFDKNTLAFVSKLSDARWSCCDDPAMVTDFIAQRDTPGSPVQQISQVWGGGDEQMHSYASKNWNGDPIWGKTRNTWIKFVYR